MKESRGLNGKLHRQKSIEQLEGILRYSPGFITIIDREHRYLRVSRSVCRFLGLAEAEIIGKSYEAFLPPAVASDFRKRLETVFMNHESLEVEDAISIEGKMSFFCTNIFPIFDEAGDVTAVCGIATDISERKKAETILKISEERFRTIFEINPIGIGMISLADLRIRQANDRFCEITGYSREEMLQMDLEEITHPDDIGNNIQQIHALVRGEIPVYAAEKRYVRKDGGIRWINLTATLLPKRYGGLQMLIGMIEDITERKHWQEILQEARAEAETANKAKSDFLANMSHELRTPLNAILGYAQLMRDDVELTDQHRNGVEIIYRSGEHLLMLISDILDLSRIEAGKVELASEDLHLPSFLESIAEMIRFRAQERGLLFDCCIRKDLSRIVSADPKRLRQILLNLLSNAVKYTLKGSVLFEVYRKGGLICFRVADTGVGIPEAETEQIFQPFHQIRDRRIHAEGTGLGLSISRKLVEMMGGTLRVESRKGRGSTFWFSLDLPTVDRAVEPDPPIPERRIIGYEGERVKVLIVDDQIFNRGLLRRLLEPLGFEITEAGDGSDALVKNEIFTPDLILMDLIMPRMDGRDATRQIREKAGKGPVIIGVSADVTAETIAEALEAGCDDFSMKPVNIRDLLEKVGQYLGLRWIYERRQGSPRAGINEKDMVPPSPEDMDALQAMAMIGDISGINAYARKLESGPAQWQPFVQTLGRYARNCQIKKIKALIAKYHS